jgi:transposase
LKIVDRFHVAKLYRNGLDELRKKELKRLKKELSKEEYKKLRGAMGILRKDIEGVKVEDLEVLKWLFKCSPLLELAYKLCNVLTDIFEGDYSKSEAKRKINRWKKRVIKSRLSCFNRFLSTLDYFINRQTSGFVEGFNNTIKVIKRRCYGILTLNICFSAYIDALCARFLSQQSYASRNSKSKDRRGTGICSRTQPPFFA